MNAMIKSAVNSNTLNKLLKNALTNQINSREMFLKGIDYSYYYEENKIENQKLEMFSA
jgi:cell filamentation protein